MIGSTPGWAPGWAEVLTSWRPSPVSDLLILIATLGYLWAARRVARDRQAGGWPWRRGASWLLAVATLVVAINGPVGVYGDVLFWVHMVQHLALIMVVPVLLVWAQPLRLVRAVLGRHGQASFDAAINSRSVRWGTGPLVGLACYAVVVVPTHLTGFQQLSMTYGWVRALELALYLVGGYLFFLPLAGAELGPWSLPHLVRFVVLAIGMGVDTLTGVVLMLTTRPLAPAYAAMHPGWGPGVLDDQQLAGGVMWFGGDLLMMLLMVVVAVQWGRASEDRHGLGSWLEGARRHAVMGEQAAWDASEVAGSTAGAEGEATVDADERALAAYNARLAALHGLPPPPASPPRPLQDRSGPKS